MDSEPRFALGPRVFFGIFVLVVGLLILLDNLGYVDIGNYWRYWPVALMAVGVSKLIQPHRGRAAGFIFLALGTWLLLDSLGYVAFDWRIVWPGALVVIGITMIARGFGRGRSGGAEDASSHVRAFALLGGVEHKLTSKNFRGGDATAIMGGCDLDLRGASIADGEALIDVLAIWGGVDIKVPEDWTVVVNGMPIMGAFVDKRNRTTATDPAKRLVIRGLVLMGGVEIKS